MHYFIALSILALAVLPALLSLAAGLGYNSALLPLRNWELLVFMIGATAAGSWCAFVGADPYVRPGQTHGSAPTGINVIARAAGPWQSHLPWLFLMSAIVSTLTSGADLYQFWSMPFLALLVWLMLYSGLARRDGPMRPPQGDHMGSPLQILLNAIRLAALLNAAVAFAQFFGINPLFSPTTGGRPVTGLFDNPNRFGAFLAIALPLFFVGAGSPRVGADPRVRPGQTHESAPTEYLQWIGAALVGLAVLLSRSTFAILAMMAGLGYFVFRSRPWARQRLAPTLAISTIGMIILASLIYLDPPSRANLLRYQIYKKSVSIALERPILGHGLGQFDKVFNARPPEVKDPPRRVTHAHNEYLELFVEQGLIGLAILGLFLWQLFHRGGFETRPYKASLIALMVDALGFYPMRVPLIALMAAIVLAGVGADPRVRPIGQTHGSAPTEMGRG